MIYSDTPRIIKRVLEVKEFKTQAIVAFLGIFYHYSRLHFLVEKFGYLQVQ